MQKFCSIFSWALTPPVLLTSIANNIFSRLFLFDTGMENVCNRSAFVYYPLARSRQYYLYLLWPQGRRRREPKDRLSLFALWKIFFWLWVTATVASTQMEEQQYCCWLLCCNCNTKSFLVSNLSDVYEATWASIFPLWEETRVNEIALFRFYGWGFTGYWRRR